MANNNHHVTKLAVKQRCANQENPFIIDGKIRNATKTQTYYVKETPAHRQPKNEDTPPSGYTPEPNLGAAVQLNTNFPNLKDYAKNNLKNANLWNKQAN